MTYTHSSNGFQTCSLVILCYTVQHHFACFCRNLSEMQMLLMESQVLKPEAYLHFVEIQPRKLCLQLLLVTPHLL